MTLLNFSLFAPPFIGGCAIDLIDRKGRTRRHFIAAGQRATEILNRLFF